MDTKKVAKEYRLSQWAQTIQARRDSGQSVKDFCQRAGISRNAYFYWQKKLREAACTELAGLETSQNFAPNGWARLAASDTPTVKSGLIIEVGGCQITVNAGTDTKLLATVCHVLRSL